MVGRSVLLGLTLLVATGGLCSADARSSWTEAADSWTRAAPGSRLLSWVRQGHQVDFDDDGVVGFSDYLLFAQTYNTASGDSGYDIRMDLNTDGQVDFSDFLSFGEAYNQQEGPAQASSGYTLYVTDFGEGSLTVMDAQTHLISEYIRFRAPSSVFISSDGQTIYLSEAFALFAMDKSHQVIYSVPTETHGRIALSPDERTLYLTQELTDRLWVIDLTTREVVDSVAVGDAPIDIAITPDGRRLYVANSDSRDITVVDVATVSAVARIDLGSSPWEIVIARDGRHAYVSDPERGVISVVDLATNLVAGGIALSGDYARGLALSPDGTTLYVASETSLVSIDVTRNLVSRTLLLGDDTSTLGITPDGSRIYVATLKLSSGGPGISVVDAADWRELGRVRGFLFPSEMQFLPQAAVAGPR